MAHESEHTASDVKVHFTTREGMYQQIATSEFFYPKRVPYSTTPPPSPSALVKTSYVNVKQNEADGEEEDCVCFTVGKTLYYFTYSAFKQGKQCNFVDKRVYRGSAPSCHDINQNTATSHSVKVAVGFLAGQVQIIDVRKKESLQIMNEDRSMDKSSVTCVKWYPNNDNLILSAHICGFMYTYDITQTCPELPPIYHPQPYKVGEGYSIYTVKSKSSSGAPSNSFNSSSSSLNPLYKWVMSTDGTAVCSFQFSPCSRFVAVVTQNGYLRVIDHQTFESYGCMKSYFGGLLTCSWSPDGRFIVTGGEDDLITVWSFCQQCVVARGSSHKSWVSDVAFDRIRSVIPSDSDMKTFYNLPTVDEFVAARKASQSSDQFAFADELPEASTLDTDDGKTPNLLKFKSLDTTPPAFDNTKPTRCNGDSKLSVSSDAIKRLRTYSNVSRLSRLSLGIDRPQLCYRFGSVGQDSQLCLWELDESTIDFMRRKPSVMKRREVASKSTEQQSTDELRDSGIVNESNPDLPLAAESSSSEISSGGSNNVQYYLHNQTPANHPTEVPPPLAATSRSSSVPHSINSSTSQSKKDSRRQGKTGSTSNGLSVIRKFATIGSHDRVRKVTKQQHKRNLSLPHFGNKSNSTSTSGSKAALNKDDQQATQVFGTVLCPCLEDTVMLDPLTCKKISLSRLTSLSFTKECILIACQEGYMQAWERPKLIEAHPTPPPFHSPGSEAEKQNGTVV